MRHRSKYKKKLQKANSLSAKLRGRHSDIKNYYNI